MSQSDLVTITGVTAFGYHGVLPEERANGQEFVTDVEMQLDLTAAAETDDLARTVDYSSVAAHVVEVVEGEPCQLIETLAARIAAAVLVNELVTAARVTVHKPHAPVGVPFTDVSVTLECRR